MITKEILSERTNHYQSWVEAFARNHRIPIEWAEKGIRKEDFVLRWQRRMVRNNAYGVYFVLKSMEVGPTFRIAVPLCGTLANSRFHHRPNAQDRPHSRLELAYHRADKAIEKIFDLLAAA